MSIEENVQTVKNFLAALVRRDQFHQSILADYTASPRFNAAIQGLGGATWPRWIEPGKETA